MRIGVLRNTRYEGAMASETENTAPASGNTSEVPSQSEVFAGEIGEGLSEQQVFAGDEDFYKHLAKSARSPLASIGHKRFWHLGPLSAVQKILAFSIVVVVAVLLYSVLKSPSELVGSSPTPTDQIAPVVPKTVSSELLIQDTAQKVSQQIQKPQPVLSPTQPLSLEVAQNFYLQKDYAKAYAVYDRLRQNLTVGVEEELIRDFLQLRMALCMKKMADIDKAERLFRTVSKSRSPIVRSVANYHRTLAEIQKKQYLKARTRAYQVIALIGAVDKNRDSSLFLLERDCYFLAAECLSRKVLSLSDTDKDLPAELWGSSLEPDPFTGLTEVQLRRLLNSGSERLSKALLGPRIQKLIGSGAAGSARWSVACNGAPIEELLARFSANAGLDIQPAIDNWQLAIGKRPVSLYLPAATSQQAVSIAAGSVGLLARMDDKGIVDIFNPAEYSSLAEHISLLSSEAISLWQRFLLAFHEDKRIPNVHFALGLLHAQKGRATESIAEYKLVANRFSYASLAPFALLHSSRLKTKLRDYSGARRDLNQLVEQYPDAELASRAYLYLADASKRTGRKNEAARLYRKIYNLGLSLESQTTAALGAGGCFYEIKDYQSAVKWLTRYIGLARDHASKDLYSAYFLLGKANMALGKSEAACGAFQYVLARKPELLSSEEHAEVISALVEARIQQEQFVEALDVLENINLAAFSQKESIGVLLLRSRILRAMGLVDKAIAVLGDRLQYLVDSQLQVKISLELTNCYIAKGELELARRDLAEILILVEPGPLAHEVALNLADVCLKLGQNSRTISVCSQLLDSGPSAQIKQKALNILATVYNRQKNYDGAALALLGRWK